MGLADPLENIRPSVYIHPFNGPFPGLPRWAGTRKVKPIWILLKQETVSGTGNSWAICKYAPRSRQTTTPAPHHSVFYSPDALPATQPTASKHWRHWKHLHYQRNVMHKDILSQCKQVCCSTDSDRPHRCCHPANSFGSCRIFPILHNCQWARRCLPNCLGGISWPTDCLGPQLPT